MCRKKIKNFNKSIKHATEYLKENLEKINSECLKTGEKNKYLNYNTLTNESLDTHLKEMLNNENNTNNIFIDLESDENACKDNNTQETQTQTNNDEKLNKNKEIVDLTLTEKIENITKRYNCKKVKDSAFPSENVSQYND